MKTKSKSINFGKVDHFLYVRLMCLSADLGLPLRELIQYGYYLLVELITEDGQSQFEVLYENYKKYSDIRGKVRYAPRKEGLKHPIVVKNVHEEVYQHLVVIRKEKNYAWGMLLYVLLMAIEQELDKKNNMFQEKRQGELEEKFDEYADLFIERFNPYEGGYHIDRTKLRRDYDNRADIGLADLWDKQ